MFTRSRRLSALAVLTALLLVPVLPAVAADEAPGTLLIVGEPTAGETAEIDLQWNRFREAFPAAASCLGPLTVQVVARAEDHWPGTPPGAIAAFYWNDEVIIEHGKVNGENLIHEFAHHLDLTCGFGDSALGEAFQASQGFAADHDWYRGARWSDVPAEFFAEAVVGYLGIDSVDLPVTTTGFDQIGAYATGFAAANQLAGRGLRRGPFWPV